MEGRMQTRGERTRRRRRRSVTCAGRAGVVIGRLVSTAKYKQRDVNGHLDEGSDDSVMRRRRRREWMVDSSAHVTRAF
jgi:hypothetical protein